MPHVDQALLDRGPERRKCKMNVHSLFFMARGVASTKMICSLPSKMAQSFADAHKLKSFPLPLEDVSIQLYLCWHRRFDADPGHTWMRDALTRLLSRH